MVNSNLLTTNEKAIKTDNVLIMYYIQYQHNT